METLKIHYEESKEIWTYDKTSSIEVYLQSTYLHVWSSSSRNKS